MGPCWSGRYRRYNRKGSIGVHVICLRKWVKGKALIRDGRGRYGERGEKVTGRMSGKVILLTIYLEKYIYEWIYKYSLDENFPSELTTLPPRVKDHLIKSSKSSMKKNPLFQLLVRLSERLPKHYRLLRLLLVAPEGWKIGPFCHKHHILQRALEASELELILKSPPSGTTFHGYQKVKGSNQQLYPAVVPIHNNEQPGMITLQVQ